MARRVRIDSVNFSILQLVGASEKPKGSLLSHIASIGNIGVSSASRRIKGLQRENYLKVERLGHILSLSLTEQGIAALARGVRNTATSPAFGERLFRKQEVEGPIPSRGFSFVEGRAYREERGSAT